MEAIKKELQERKSEIEEAIDIVFKANMKITDWDVPEADDKEAANIILAIMQTKINQIKVDIDSGKFDNY
jgi:AAA+ ATPase superfamily predicted ATPase